MTEVPFDFSLDSVFPHSGRQLITCIGLLRDIPGRRKVYDALWNERAVVVKIFFGRILGFHHLKREWNGLNQLRKRAISSPEPLFYGRVPNGGWALVMEKITSSEPAIEFFHRGNSQQKAELLLQLCRLLAEHHQKGVLQWDLHMGNFLLQSDKLFVIDPAEMKFYSAALGRKKSIHQLASLAASMPDDEEFLERLLKEYVDTRNWKYDDSQKEYLRQQIAVHRKKTISRALKKTLRSSKRYLREKTGGWRGVFSKDFCGDIVLRDFVEQIDSLMEEGGILKDGNTCYVSRVKLAGWDVVIKRYNHKGLMHSLRHTIKGCRAKKVWVNGHLLGMLNIATPRPLAYIEKRRGLLVWQSYIITEFMDGPNLHKYLSGENLTDEQRTETLKEVEQVLDVLGRSKISHGDLKCPNILITPGAVALTDLDAMRVHRFAWMHKIRHRRDLDDFYARLSSFSVSSDPL